MPAQPNSNKSIYHRLFFFHKPYVVRRVIVTQSRTAHCKGVIPPSDNWGAAMGWSTTVSFTNARECPVVSVIVACPKDVCRLKGTNCMVRRVIGSSAWEPMHRSMLKRDHGCPLLYLCRRWRKVTPVSVVCISSAYCTRPSVARSIWSRGRVAQLS